MTSKETPSQYQYNRLFVFQFQPQQLWYALNPSWAIIAGTLVALPMPTTPNILFPIVLLWFLVDPLLGSLSQLFHHQRLSQAPETTPRHTQTLLSIPYLRSGSAADRLLQFFTQIFNYDNGQGFTLTLVIPLSILVAAYLGTPVMAYALATIMLVLTIPYTLRWFWLYALVEFMVPYLLALQFFAVLTPLAIVVGVIFYGMYYGTLLLQREEIRGKWFVMAGLGLMALLLFGLQKPFWAMPSVLAIIFCRLIMLRVTDTDNPDRASTQFLKQSAFFVLISILVTSWAIRGGG
ncbi:MAG: hypothetical protein AAF629_22775 [Chloroflexota bacterium]